MVEASTYSDEIEDRKYGNRHFAHTPNPGCGEYNHDRDYEEGECIVTGIREFSIVVGDFGASLADRAEALEMLIHLVGDIHQPLHVAF